MLRLNIYIIRSGHFICFFIFETGSHAVAMADLELTIWSSLAFNLLDLPWLLHSWPNYSCGHLHRIKATVSAILLAGKQIRLSGRRPEVGMGDGLGG